MDEYRRETYTKGKIRKGKTPRGLGRRKTCPGRLWRTEVINWVRGVKWEYITKLETHLFRGNLGKGGDFSSDRKRKLSLQLFGGGGFSPGMKKEKGFQETRRGGEVEREKEQIDILTRTAQRGESSEWGNSGSGKRARSLRR